MDPLQAVVIVLALLVVSTVFGLLWRARQGRVRAAGGAVGSRAVVIRAADVGASVDFGASATLLQFSTEFCARCPGTRRLLGQIADARHGVTHIDVDLTHRADLAARYSVLQTPTTLILDGGGSVRARVGGPPKRAEITRQLDDLMNETTTPPVPTPLRSRNVRTE